MTTLKVLRELLLRIALYGDLTSILNFKDDSFDASPNVERNKADGWETQWH